MRELRVKEILNQRGISVSEFAKMIGVSREHCYSIIKGANLSQKRMELMAQVLNIPLSALFVQPQPIESEYNPYEIIFGRTEHYNPNDIITFCKLSEPFGEFSNMHTAFPGECCGYRFKTSEHLFIALRLSGYDKIQKEIMEYPNAMYCKKTFVNSDKYKEFHHPEWHTNLFDVEVMKYVCKLKYEQNKGFRELLAKTKGKIIVEDATMQNTNESVLKWGCQDLEKKSLIKDMRKQVQKAIRELQKSAKAKTNSLKKPRSAEAQKRFDDKLDHQISSMEKSLEICEKAIMSNAHFTVSGKNTMGKSLTLLRDTEGNIEYNLEFPLYLFGEKVK